MLIPTQYISRRITYPLCFERTHAFLYSLLPFALLVANEGENAKSAVAKQHNSPSSTLFFAHLQIKVRLMHIRSKRSVRYTRRRRRRLHSEVG